MRQFSFPVLRFLSSKNVFLCVETSEKSFFFSFTKKMFRTWSTRKENVSFVPSGLPYTEIVVFGKQLCWHRNEYSALTKTTLINNTDTNNYLI